MDNNNLNFDINKYLHENSKSIKDYILLIRNNLFTFITIVLLIIIAAVGYTIYKKNVYKSTVTLKITREKRSVLESGTQPQMSTMADDRFILNELEVITNYDTRVRYAKALIDSFEVSKDKNLFYIVKAEKGDGKLLPEALF